jgi:hypothetical protein
MIVADNSRLSPARVLLRGNQNRPGKEVPRQFVRLVAGDQRQPFIQGSGRLELAQAIVAPDNPLTARVIANRIWMHHFDAPLVTTPSDFGIRSEEPTHPALLDYLAARLLTNGWSLKDLHRQIMASNTYRQASTNRPECKATDPENRLLWRMNRRRLDVEALRDSLLAISGQLDLSPAESTVTHLPDQATADEPEPWMTLRGVPTLGQAGDFAPLSLRFRDRRKPRGAPPAMAPTGEPRRDPAPASSRPHDHVVDAIADLRSGDPERIHRALAIELTPELSACTIDLLGRDEVARAALAALNAAAWKCTGMLVDALLDHGRDVAVRRRLPAVLLAGEPSLASWGLWRALVDPSFDVRYRSGAVLARLAAAGHLRDLSMDDVFEAVRRELLADRSVLANHRLVDDVVGAGDERAADPPPHHHGGAGLEHVFTVLGLVLPAEPLRIALHAVQTDDPELRGTALEYLESILPADVRAQLWPLLEGEISAPAAALAPRLAPAVPDPAAAASRTRRSPDEIVTALHLSYPAILEKLRQRPKPA